MSRIQIFYVEAVLHIVTIELLIDKKGITFDKNDYNIPFNKTFFRLRHYTAVLLVTNSRMAITPPYTKVLKTTSILLV